MFLFNIMQDYSLFIDKPLELMLLKMFLLSLLAQLIIYQVGLIPSQYFSVLGKKDLYEFNKVTAVALILIVLNSLVR